MMIYNVHTSQTYKIRLANNDFFFWISQSVVKTVEYSCDCHLLILNAVMTLIINVQDFNIFLQYILFMVCQRLIDIEEGVSSA